MDEQELSQDRESFSVGSEFEAKQPGQALGLGPLELSYQELFADVLADGVITDAERQRLNKVADNLGLNKERLERLEQAMTTAYESHHRTRVVQEIRDPLRPLSPLLGAPPLTTPREPPPSSGAFAPGAMESLQAENEQLRQRIALLERELEQAQAAVHVEVSLAGWEADVGTHDSEAAWRLVRQDPAEEHALRELLGAYRAEGNDDGAFLCLQALAVVGRAREDEQVVLERHRRLDLIAPPRALDEDIWTSCLMHSEQERTTGALFSVITPALLVGRVTALRRDGRLPALPAEQKQEIAQSTVMGVRAVAWGSALLGLHCPSVYLDVEEAGGYVHIVKMPPCTLLGRGVLSGRGLLQLAFLVGQHLCYYRGEHFIKTMFSATEDLEDLFLAALLLANPQLPLSGPKRARVEPLARAIEPLLEPTQLDALRGHYLRFADEGGRTNLMRWSHAVDKTATRAGLVLCQDLGVACGVLAEQEGPLGPLALELISFATSSRFLSLRKNLRVAHETEATSS